MIWLQALAYAAVFVFAVVMLYRFVKYSTMPLHLRWELYPVPHEPHRAEYGGSYYEEPEWWKKPRETSLAGELKEMLAEMLFIVRLYKNNRRQWYFSFPFHGGIYLILLWFVLIFAAAAASLLGLSDEPLMSLALPVGLLGMVALTVGCIGLLLLRLSDPNLRKYSAPLDYLNLLFILAVVLTGFAAWSVDRNFTIAESFARSMLTFSPPPKLSGEIALHVALLSLLVMYIPFTKMSHYLAKYFTYHKILWEDEPSLPGSRLRERIKATLTKYRVHWSAPHVVRNLTWAEEATTPLSGGQKEGEV
ncbi:MAG: respiratory nitrate reductase subunit gamma [Archaeoglobaceae archaeon]